MGALEMGVVQLEFLLPLYPHLQGKHSFPTMMTARRQASTTSLAKYARASSPVLQDRNLDFCNAFWGIADGGVEVLFARMRGATRTIEELKNFWKERSVHSLIEAQTA